LFFSFYVVGFNNVVANGWGCVLRWGLEQSSYPPDTQYRQNRLAR